MPSRLRLLLVAGLAAALLPLVVNGAAVQVEKDRITGRVFNSSTNRGVPGLSVRLIAPRATKSPVRVTITNANGEFAFRELTVGRYLLSIYRGTTLVFQKEIDNSVSQAFTVPLKPVAGAR